MTGGGPDTVTLRLATRGSALALWQADHVTALLHRAAGAAGSSVLVEKVIVETMADQRLDIPIDAMGGKGVFVKEIQAAVLDGRADLAVHSGKDLPALTPAELVIAAVPERGDVRDVLVGSTLDGLPHGGHVATGSIRRKAQLASLRPDLVFSGLRGNIATRLEKASGFDAIVMAAAALERLGISLDDREVQFFEPSVMLPQVAQGALVIECRTDDQLTQVLLAALDHRPSRVCVDAERAFLAELGGDCDLPVGAYVVIEENELVLSALVAAPDGTTMLRDSRRCGLADGEATGRAMARFLLDDAGGSALLGR
ncbi:MAG: hydroxymethylbilane synthase [Acidimicrobiales bacterium]